MINPYTTLVFYIYLYVSMRVLAVCSSPEKVFEYFASIQIGDETYMTVFDFIRCVTPYNKHVKSEVGSKNFKYNWQAKNMGATKVYIKFILLCLCNERGVLTNFVDCNLHLIDC